jgi:exopolyphosphatase/guanosine-5'-triphosphate,3'-diphosphate pyrophosphatase
LNVQLVRHAKAEKKKSRWDGPAPLRPLTLLGLRQARALAERLGGRDIDRIVSSPALRCRQTLEPLAREKGLPIEAYECLAKGEAPAKAAEFIAGLDADSIVCCTHWELIPDLVSELQELGVDVELASREVDEGHERADDEPRRLAVLDMGSTSFHLLVADVTRAGHLQPVDRVRSMLRLGVSVGKGSRIPDDVFERAVAAAAEKREIAEALGAERLIAVGTAALRDARNGAELSARIAEAVRVPVRLLTGEEEARVIFAAFRRRVVLPRGPALGVDLGGGSLELAVGDEDSVLFETTLRLGVTRLQGELGQHDPMKKRDVLAIRSQVSRSLEAIAPSIERLAPSLAVVAGGTARALGELVIAGRDGSPARTINGLEIPLRELRETTERLVRATHAERLEMRGMRRRRADLLPIGALVLLALAESLELGGLTVCDWGLREGVLLDAATEP